MLEKPVKRHAAGSRRNSEWSPRLSSLAKIPLTFIISTISGRPGVENAITLFA
jgi:hypothetical protein